MVPGPTRYARSGDFHIAYSITGEGPLDILYVPTWLSQLEHLWEVPTTVRFFARLAEMGRLIVFDRRGSGMSDPSTNPPTLEEQMDDVRAVMDAAGSERANVVAMLDGGPMAMLFAATHPDRVASLVLYGTFARTLRSDDIPWAETADQRAVRLSEWLDDWGQGQTPPAFAPSLAGDASFRAWFAKLQRLTAGPGAARRALYAANSHDVRAVLPTIRVPTLVMHRAKDSTIDPQHAGYLAERIPGAKLVRLPGHDNFLGAGHTEAIVDEVDEFITGERHERPPDRVLATVLFTDICDSTARAAELGDARWRDLLERHDDLVRRHLGRYRGREVKTTGDGFLATFDGPARAIRCAGDISQAVRALGIEIRAGLHTGECEVRGDDVAGMAVHIGARVGAAARKGEVLVSSTVRDLVVGSGIEFSERGEHELKGVPGQWRLFAAHA
jgi:class 3 adenylate cyclase/alpha-beta hydrolase superfamily lysophospholipase